MEAHPVIHPSADALRAFALGKSNDATASALMSHLDVCPDCCKQVSALSGDDFLNRLRQAHGRNSTPAPAKGLVDAARAAKPPASQTPIPNLPLELANNPQYEILRELGRGGMGVVYLAKNKLMDRLEVLKVVNKTLLDHPGAVERFLREIRSAAKLSHANVVAAYSAVQQGELLAFAMEYVQGEDLAAVVKSQGPLPIAHACFYVQQAALGLQHAFEKQMVHRDIKPQNLILAREGKKHIVKVLDFGLAKVIREKTEDTGLTGEGKMLGTPDYIAPEQTLDAAKADIRADIYSLGCTLYYLLSGRPPFSASSLGAILLAHQMQEAKPLNLLRPEVPVELAAVVRKMMAKNPAKRYQTPLEVVQALAPFVKQGTRPKSSPELSMGAAKESVVVKAVKTESPPVPIAPVKSPPPPAAAPPAVAWESLTAGSILSAQPRKSGVIRKCQTPVRKPWSKQTWLLGSGVGVGVLLLALLGMWTGGVFQVKTKDGILTIKVNEPNPDVFVDGEKVIADAKPNPDVGSRVPRLPIGKETPATITEVKEPLPPKIEKRNPGKLFKVNQVLHGKWIIRDDYLEQTSFDENAWLGFGDPDWKDYDFAVEVMRGEGIEQQVCQGFRLKWRQGMFLYGLGWARNTLFTIEKQRPGSIQMFGQSKGHVDAGKWYKMLVRVRGKHMQCFLDDTKHFDFESDEHPSGCVGLRTWRTRYRFRNIKVTAPDGTVLLEGLPDLNHELPGEKGEAPAATSAAASQSPARVESGLPPEAKAAAKAFDKSREDARAKFLTEFDTVVDRLAKLKGATELRLKLIEAVKEEKKRFENEGLIPWSEPMRPFLAKYLASLGVAEEKLHRAYNSLINAQLRAKKESAIADLQADLSKVVGVRLMARWRHFVDGRPSGIGSVYSNGRINNINGNATWTYAQGVLTYRWPDAKAPRGAWIDTLIVSADGTAYAGTNNGPPGRRPKLTGVYLKPD